MKSNMIHQIASLVMALVMILGNTIHTRALPIVQAAGPSIYWGAFVNADVPSSTNMQGSYNTFETYSGKKMSIIHWGQPWMMKDGTWGEFQTSYFSNVRNHGSIPMINWGSHRLGSGATQADFQLRDIYNGAYDAYIRRWATDAKNWGHPFFLRFDHEMNAWWYAWGEGTLAGGAIVNGNSAGDYIKAWRHVHDIFESVGATNVTWVWAPNQVGNNGRYASLSSLYPGDAYVDWTGLDVYNKYSTWAGLNPLMTGSDGLTWVKDSYSLVLGVAPNKPMMLSEFASIEAGDGGAKKAAWITDALTKQIPINFPKIKAIVWFNWQETPDESYLIESSTAAKNAWAAGIGSSIYASNQYSNLNTSPIPALTEMSHSISGNVGTGWATLRYSTNGTTQSVVADQDGNYSITVPMNWGGVIVPSHPCYTFNATNRSYSSVVGNQTGQNYTATYNAAAGCANASVKIGGNSMGNYGVPSNGRATPMYPGIQTGPVKVSSDTPIFASERSLYGPYGTFNEVMGLPNTQLTNHYWFTWYDNKNMRSWVSVANPSTSQNANVKIKIAGQVAYSRTLGPNSIDNPQFQSVQTGPVEVLSDNPIITSERALYGPAASFNEVMGISGNQITNHYWFPWYDSKMMSTWVLVANPDTNSPATVTIKIAGQQVYSKTLGHGEIDTPTFPNVQTGPVEVLSDNPIITSERSLFGPYGTFNEVMGYPDNQLTGHYWFPWYDNKAMSTWVLVGNPDEGNSTTVTIKIAGQQVYSKTLGPHGIDTPTFSVQDGPVEVSSSRAIFTSERTLYGEAGSFNEVMGYPNNQLTTEYWFTRYDGKDMATWVLVGKP